MKEYKVNKHVTKKEFIENGFSYSRFNILQSKKYLYKNLILLTITVDFTEDNIEIYTDITYSNGNTYPLYNEYIILLNTSLKKQGAKIAKYVGICSIYIKKTTYSYF